MLKLETSLMKTRYYREAREEAIREGLKKGLEQGLEDGRRETSETIAKKMLEENLPTDMIVKITGLSKRKSNNSAQINSQISRLKRMTVQEKNKIRPLSKQEEEILEALHFMLSFEEVVSESNLEREMCKEVLRVLIRDGLVQALQWQPDKNDFIPLDELPDKWQDLHFLATKHGLFSYHTS